MKTKLAKTFFPDSFSFIRNPLVFDEFDNIFDKFEDIFKFPNYLDKFGGSLLTKYTKKPAMNVSNTEKEYIIELSVPGLSKEDIKIEFNDNDTLTISGKKKTEKSDKRTGYSYSEFSYDTFERILKLPEDTDTSKLDTITAKHENGVLTLTIPKLQEDKKDIKSKREIKII